jgi:hypothetical protein
LIGTKGAEIERFLLVFVPIGKQWFLDDIVHPQNIAVGKSGFPEIPGAAAARLLDALKEKATPMSSSSYLSGHDVVNNLMAPGGATNVAYMEFELVGKP